ncbi:MAG: ABC transporter ATP-binding protein, partial [Bacteroidales bacterium]
DFNISFKSKKNLWNFPISTSLQKGSVVCIAGVNGVGKTTLLKAIAGLHTYKSGSIEIHGIAMERMNLLQLSSVVSLTLSSLGTPAYIRVNEFVSLGRYNFSNVLGVLKNTDIEEIDKLFHALKIETISDKLLSEISDGERQKTFIANNLVRKTPIALFDEPTNFLDILNKETILGYLCSYSKSELQPLIIFSSHDIYMAYDFTDIFIFISNNEPPYIGKPHKTELNEIIKLYFKR